MTYFPLRQTTCFFIPLVAPCKPLLELVDELYDEAVETGVCCVFRHNNLPAKMVLPKFMCDFKNRVGLFQRCGELK